MASKFTFVPVNAGTKFDVEAEDRLMIRSLAATNPWNRPLEGETVVPGKRRRQRKTRQRVTLATEPAKKLTITYTTYSDSIGASSGGNEKENVFSWSRNVPPALLTQVRSGLIDPFWAMVIPHRPFLSEIFDHRLKHFCPPLPGFEKPSSNTFLLRRFKAHCDSPVAMYADLLWTAAHLYTGSRINREALASVGAKEKEAILWLKGSAISSMRDALHNGSSIPEANLLCAILVLAAFEKVYGDQELHKAHMAGAKKLLAARGGVTSMQESSKQMLEWILQISSVPGGINGIIENAPVSHPSIWTGHFLCSGLFLDVVHSQISESAQGPLPPSLDLSTFYQGVYDKVPGLEV